MQIKPLPAPPTDLDTVWRVRRAVPLVPAPDADCCARLVSRVDLEGRDEARRWLTLLRGLGLAVETDRGFARTRREVDEDALVEAFRSGVYGAEEAISVLSDAEAPLSPDAVLDRLEPGVPPWERRRRPGSWREDWTDRTARLLDWLVLLGLAERVGDRYASA